jgi:hypothetical protein
MLLVIITKQLRMKTVEMTRKHCCVKKTKTAALIADIAVASKSSCLRTIRHIALVHCGLPRHHSNNDSLRSGP